MKTISATEFNKLLEEGKALQILDVRTFAEHKEVHLSHPHKQVPIDELNPENLSFDKSQPLYILCAGGKRATRAAEKFENAIVVEGGLMGCIDCGAQVTRKECMSLERQVRVAAGAIIVFSYLFDLGFLGFLVGAGLIFAGVTNNCYMAMLLAKAPWNQKTGASCSTK